MGTLIYALAITGIFELVAGLTQQDLNNIGRNLGVRVKLTDNLVNDGQRHTMQITLTNDGRQPMDTNGLEMYFHSFFMIEPDYLPDPNGYNHPDNVKLDHINGMLFKAEFLPSYGMLLPGQSRVLNFNVQDWAVSKTDVPNNWYVSGPNLNAVTLAATAVSDQSFVEDFVDPNQYKRYNADVYSPFTPIERFTRIKADDIGKRHPKVINGIVPTPKVSAFDTATPVTIDNSWAITAAPSLQNEAAFLGEKLGITTIDTPRATKSITLEIGNTGSADPDSYVIKSLDCADAISIVGGSQSGVFYGIQSLLSLMSENGDVTRRTLPGFEIQDEPRYEYRGVHLDVARNFHPKETVKKLIDTMAQYKLNKLHLHLSDDEAWRLEIPGLPELTSVGGRRCHDDLSERRCLLPQLGSGPLAVAPGSGFYRQSDYREILQHATDKHVEVIPEFQMPSHAHAAIKAMLQRYRTKGDIDHLLSDLEDNSDYLSVQMFNDDAMNPCIESTYNFLRIVIKKIKEMHKGITPLKIFNLGGESIPDGAWVNSSACRKAFPNVSHADIPVYAKAYFMARLARMVIVEEGLKMAGYEDAFFLNGEPLPGGSDNLLVYPYQNVWEWGLANRAYKFANAKYPVVMSPVTMLSFDHPYEPDPNERGLYWASRFTDTHKVFGLRPDDLYKNIDVKRSGEPLTRQDVCGLQDENCPPLEARFAKNIKGIQSFGWTELIKDKDTLEYMFFPRVLALAERAWNKGDWESRDKNSEVDKNRDWELFANKVGHNEFPRLDKMGVRYRVPPPGVAVSTNNNQNFQVTLKAEFPGLRLQYSMDGGNTYIDYVTPFPLSDVNQTILTRTLSTDGLRSSRVIGFAGNDIVRRRSNVAPAAAATPGK